MNGRLKSLAAGGFACLVCGLGPFGSAAFGQDDVRLPVGMTLLGADDTACEGDLMLESGVDEADEDVRRIEEGRYATFQVDNENVGWVCLGDSSRSDTMECPAGTTYVRILRNDESRQVVFECYGRS